MEDKPLGYSNTSAPCRKATRRAEGTGAQEANLHKAKKLVLAGGSEARVSKKKVVRISTIPQTSSFVAEPQPLNLSALKKVKTTELLLLVNETTGRHINARTRKQVLLAALLSPRSE